MSGVRVLSEKELLPLEKKMKDDYILESRGKWVDLEKLQFAIEYDLDQVVMHGVVFNCRHKGDSIFVQKNGASVPCGWFSNDTIKHLLITNADS